MSGIVIKLQYEALNKDTDILTLLRKAYLISRKLKLESFEKWIESEQNGYKSKTDEMPDYRKVTGEVKAWNPYGGWIPVLFDKSIGIEVHYVRDSIASLVDVYKNAETKFCTMNFAPEMNTLLNKMSTVPFDTKFCLQVPLNSIFNIFDQVRNKILDWSITLEENGIVGDGLNFSDEERQKAVNTPSIINYTNNFFSSVNDSKIQIDNDNSEQK